MSFLPSNVSMAWADAAAMGARTYSMRIWLKPDVMATYGITPTDISNALAEQNIESAPG